MKRIYVTICGYTEPSAQIPSCRLFPLSHCLPWEPPKVKNAFYLKHSPILLRHEHCHVFISGKNVRVVCTWQRWSKCTECSEPCRISKEMWADYVQKGVKGTMTDPGKVGDLFLTHFPQHWLRPAQRKVWVEWFAEIIALGFSARAQCFCNLGFIRKVSFLSVPV